MFVNIPHSYKVHKVCVLLSLCGCLNCALRKFLMGNLEALPSEEPEDLILKKRFFIMVLGRILCYISREIT